jgi:hypothetical protein
MNAPQAQDRTQRIYAVANWLAPIASPVEKEAEYSRWISARQADPEQSADWCLECARAEVGRLNTEHPEHDYLVDGGWGSETDSPPYCCQCDKPLNDHLSEYAIEAEIEHYSDYPICLRGRQKAHSAFRFRQMILSGNFKEDDPASWKFFRKLERAYKRRQGSIHPGKAS